MNSYVPGESQKYKKPYGLALNQQEKALDDNIQHGVRYAMYWKVQCIGIPKRNFAFN